MLSKEALRQMLNIHLDQAECAARRTIDFVVYNMVSSSSGSHDAKMGTVLTELGEIVDKIEKIREKCSAD